NIGVAAEFGVNWDKPVLSTSLHAVPSIIHDGDFRAFSSSTKIDYRLAHIRGTGIAQFGYLEVEPFQGVTNIVGILCRIRERLHFLIKAVANDEGDPVGCNARRDARKES